MTQLTINVASIRYAQPWPHASALSVCTYPAPADGTVAAPLPSVHKSAAEAGLGSSSSSWQQQYPPQPPPAGQQQYRQQQGGLPAGWAAGPPYSICLDNVPAGAPLAEVSELFKGAWVSAECMLVWAWTLNKNSDSASRGSTRTSGNSSRALADNVQEHLLLRSPSYLKAHG
jgi:hypothetical protein